MLTKKEQILAASTYLFRDKGYSSTSMQDIADQLEIRPASLYNHITSKYEILEELLSRGAQLFLVGLKDISESSLSSHEKLEKIISLHVKLSIEYTDLMALMAVEWRHLGKVEKSIYVKLRDEYEEGVRSILKQVILEEAIAPVDPEIALFTILTTLQRLYSWYDRNKDVNIFDMEKHLKQSLLGGITLNKLKIQSR